MPGKRCGTCGDEVRNVLCKGCHRPTAEIFALRKQRDALAAAVAAIAPACAAWLSNLPPGIRARGGGVWMWKMTSADEDEPGIGVPECEAILAATQGGDNDE